MVGRRSRALWALLVPLMVLLLAAGSFGLAQAQTQGSKLESLFCNQPTINMTLAKVRFLQQYCERLTRQPTGPPPPKRYDPMPPPELRSIPSGGPLFGVIEGLPTPPWARGEYLFKNEWLGENLVVYAGALKSDATQGVIVLARRFGGPYPEKLAVFRTPSKNGSLQIITADGDLLSLIAADGAAYKFNIAQRSLVRQ